MGLDQDEEAERLLLDVFPRFLDDRGEDDVRTQRAARRLYQLYTKIGNREAAARFGAIYKGDL